MKKKVLNIYKRCGLNTSELEQIIQAQEIQKKKENKAKHTKDKKIREIEKIEQKTGLDLTDVKSKIRRGN